MKTIFAIAILVVLCSFNSFQRIFLKEIRIGKYSYSIYKESRYLHDNRWHAEYFVVYREGIKKKVCSSFLEAKRNDSIFVNGHYAIYDNRIEFIEHYYYNKTPNSTDSIKKTFYPDSLGNLILKESTLYTNGRRTTKKY